MREPLKSPEWAHKMRSGRQGRAEPLGTAPAHAAAAERLTALIEGLGVRWLSGFLSLDHTRHLLEGGIHAERGSD
ncbi:hypothetical protein ACIGXM_26825 [Kitasatospora sp. NPDC052896]|uniref:hypothetical protein n=1 Tax=Kitasatospora sp. NPDC052896 TaxID=3364061 RepID=UPI0037C678B7